MRNALIAGRIGILLLAYVAAPCALAGSALLSWTHPTQNTDGSTIPVTGPDALASTRAQWFQCSSATATWPATPQQATVNYPASTYTVQDIGAGLWCFRVLSVNNGGVASDPSAVGTKTILPATPNPPTGLTVTDTVAFTSIKARDRTVMLPVGTVPGSTACDAQESIVAAGIAYHAVPRSAVTFSGTVRPELVWARCS